MLPEKIKADFENQWRRFGISWPDQNKHDHLLRQIRDTFDVPEERSIVLQYEDEDGDHITIGSENELLESFEYANKGVLKVFVKDRRTEPSLANQIPSNGGSLEFENKLVLSSNHLVPEPGERSMAVERYQEHGTEAEEQKDGGKEPNGASGWRRFSNQEKLAVRKTLHAADSVLGVMKPDPIIKVTRHGNDRHGGILSLLSGDYTADENYTITREREGFGVNATTGQAMTHLIGASFETYIAMTETDQ